MPQTPSKCKINQRKVKTIGLIRFQFQVWTQHQRQRFARGLTLSPLGAWGDIVGLALLFSYKRHACRAYEQRWGLQGGAVPSAGNIPPPVDGRPARAQVLQSCASRIPETKVVVNVSAQGFSHLRGCGAWKYVSVKTVVEGLLAFFVPLWDGNERFWVFLTRS